MNSAKSNEPDRVPPQSSWSEGPEAAVTSSVSGIDPPSAAPPRCCAHYVSAFMEKWHQEGVRYFRIR